MKWQVANPTRPKSAQGQYMPIQLSRSCMLPKSAKRRTRRKAVVAKPQAILHVCIEAFLRVQHVLSEAEYVVHLKKQYLTHDKFCEKSKVANMV